MQLDNSPRFTLSSDEYKQAKSSREHLHKFLMEAFYLGQRESTAQPKEAPPEEQKLLEYEPTDGQVLPKIDFDNFRSWDEMKLNHPRNNAIEIFRLKFMPVDSAEAAKFEAGLRRALMEAAEKYSG